MVFEDDVEEKFDAESCIAEILEQSRFYIHPARMEQWKSGVERSCRGMYKDSIIRPAMDIIIALENGMSMDDVLKMYDEMQLSNAGRGSVLRAVYQNSNYGTQFVYAVTKSVDHKDFDVLAAENKQFAEDMKLYREQYMSDGNSPL